MCMRSTVENRQVLKMLRIIKWRPFIRRDDGRIKIEKKEYGLQPGAYSGRVKEVISPLEPRRGEGGNTW